MQRLAALATAALLACGASADDGEGHDPIGKGKGGWREGLPGDAPLWKEGKTRLPDYPKDRDLRAIDVDTPDYPYRYSVDLKSVSIGADNVVRYTVVIESPSGVRNVYHEGIRCRSKEYKTYAIGTADGVFRETKGGGWKFMHSRGVFGYRPQLATDYLCNNLGYPYDRDEMMAKLKVAGEIQFEEDNPSWAYPGYQ